MFPDSLEKARRNLSFLSDAVSLLENAPLAKEEGESKDEIIDLIFSEILFGALTVTDVGAIHVSLKFAFQSTLARLKKARAATLYAMEVFHSECGSCDIADKMHIYKTFYNHGGIIQYSPEKKKKDKEKEIIPNLSKVPADRLMNALMEASFMWHSTVYGERSDEMEKVLKDLWDRAVTLNSAMALAPEDFYPNRSTMDPSERESVPLSGKSRFQSSRKTLRHLYMEDTERDGEEDEDEDGNDGGAHDNICACCRVTSLHQGVTDTAELISKWNCMCVSSFAGSSERTASSSAPTTAKAIKRDDVIKSVGFNRDWMAEKASLLQRWHFVSKLAKDPPNKDKILSAVNAVMKKVGL